MKIIALFMFCAGIVSVRAQTVQTVATDKQGQSFVTTSSVTDKTTLPDGSAQVNVSTLRPNADGKLVLDTQAIAVTTPAVDGVTTTTTTERRVDVNGVARLDSQVVDRTTKISDTETRTDRTIQSVDHGNGRLAITARETSITRTDGNQSTTETTIQKPAGNGWRAEAQVRTIETKAADGSIQREIIESGRPQYDRQTSSAGIGDSLRPQTKIIEREIQQADGNKVIDRQTYRRDVNGDWKPATFSIENGQKPIQ
ncbi:MAG: hypothetical protein WCS70_00800 [Verrucomicrobiota bacterium]